MKKNKKNKKKKQWPCMSISFFGGSLFWKYELILDIKLQVYFHAYKTIFLTSFKVNNYKMKQCEPPFKV